MSEREDLQKAIATVEAQRAALGDEAVDAVLRGLRHRLAALPPDDQPPNAEPGTSGGERRIVTVLFCDVTGSTALAESMDPEQWTEIIDQIFEYLIDAVTIFGGNVTRLMGDAILALFGAPVAHENDPQRAVAAGLQILKNIAPYRRKLLGERGIEFNVRVGINTGLVVTGLVGTSLHEEYTALGDAANVAARMEQTAAPGTIQISEHTFRLVAHEYECLPLGKIQVKGKSQAVQTYRVLRRKTTPGPGHTRTAQKINSSLVGRRGEYDMIQQGINRLLDGQGGIIILVGEAGVGKSRLVAEVRENIPRNMVNWLEGRTLSYGQTISYRPFQEIIWRYCGITEDDSEEEALHKLKQKVSYLFGEQTMEVLPFMAGLITLEVKDEQTDHLKLLDGEAMGHQIYLTARRFFKRMAQDKPTVLAFEDLHWADDSTARLLEHLLSLVGKVPLLFLISARPYEQSPISAFSQAAHDGFAQQTNEIVLQPLSPTHSKQLARNLLEIDRLPPDVQRMIVNKAGGNPFFLEEILRSLIDSGVVVYDADSGHWQATRKIESIAIPNTVQGVIMARLDRLDRDTRRVLQAAAVIGRRFYFRVLIDVQPVQGPLEDHLTELEQVDLIRIKQTAPELEYIFNHALVQEATYQSILLRKRRSLHLRVGKAIEQLFRARLEEFYGVLAYHFARAEEWDTAQAYLFKAGDKAGEVAADAEALAHYQQALAAYERAFGEQWDPLQRAILARKMGEAHFRRGEHERALDQFQQAFRFLGRPGIPAPHLPTILALGVEAGVQIVHRLLPDRFIRPWQADVGRAVREEARLHNLLGWIFLFTERERFLWASLRRLNFAERHGYNSAAASGGAAVAVVWDMIPLHKLALSYHRRASYQANQSGHLNSLGISSQGFSFHELNQGNFEQSTAYAHRSEQVFRRAGDLHGLGNALNLLAFNDIHQGRFQHAMTTIEELLRTGRDSADRQLVCWGQIAAGILYKRMGNFEEAEQNLIAGLKKADTLPDYYWKILGQAFIARCFLWQEKIEDALNAVEEGQKVYKKRGIGGPPLHDLRIVQAEAFLFMAGYEKDRLRKKNLKAAKKYLKAARKMADHYRLYRAENLRMEGIYLWETGNVQEARQCWDQSLATSRKLNQQYESGVTHLEMGHRLQDGSHIDAAQAIFSNIGAAYHLIRCRRLS